MYFIRVLKTPYIAAFTLIMVEISSKRKKSQVRDGGDVRDRLRLPKTCKQHETINTQAIPKQHGADTWTSRQRGDERSCLGSDTGRCYWCCDSKSILCLPTSDVTADCECDDGMSRSIGVNPENLKNIRDCSRVLQKRDRVLTDCHSGVYIPRFLLQLALHLVRYTGD